MNNITLSVAGLKTNEAKKRLMQMCFDDYVSIKVIVNDRQSQQTLMEVLPLDKLDGFYTVEEAIDFNESILHLVRSIKEEKPRTLIEKAIDRCKAIKTKSWRNPVGSKLYTKKD